jgi:hypothetical protein
MDQYIRMDQLKLDIIKEPRGFIRVLQFVSRNFFKKFLNHQHTYTTWDDFTIV